jgi:hypothetical protein
MDDLRASGRLGETEAFQIRGAVFDVHRAMGAGFLKQSIRSAWRSSLRGFLRFLALPAQTKWAGADTGPSQGSS